MTPKRIERGALDARGLVGGSLSSSESVESEWAGTPNELFCGLGAKPEEGIEATLVATGGKTSGFCSNGPCLRAPIVINAARATRKSAPSAMGDDFCTGPLYRVSEHSFPCSRSTAQAAKPLSLSTSAESPMRGLRCAVRSARPLSW